MFKLFITILQSILKVNKSKEIQTIEPASGSTIKQITVKEYLMDRAHISLLPEDVQNNINTLLERTNKLLSHFGMYRKVNSGFRPLDVHIQIYHAINERRLKENKPPLTIPMGSNHLKGAAIDLDDKDAALYNFCKENISICEELGLWFEERQGNWLHCQIFPPRSGNRFFNP